jgi:hypothetical protein
MSSLTSACLFFVCLQHAYSMSLCHYLGGFHALPISIIMKSAQRALGCFLLSVLGRFGVRSLCRATPNKLCFIFLSPGQIYGGHTLLPASGSPECRAAAGSDSNGACQSLCGIHHEQSGQSEPLSKGVSPEGGRRGNASLTWGLCTWIAL